MGLWKVILDHPERILTSEWILVVLPMNSSFWTRIWNLVNELQKFLAHYQVIFVCNCAILIINNESFFEFRLWKKWFWFVTWVFKVWKLFPIINHLTLFYLVSWSHHCDFSVLEIFFLRIYGFEYFENILLESMRVNIKVAELNEIF